MTTQMITQDFAWFRKSEPARAMFRKLGCQNILAASTSWRALRMLVVDFNECDRGCFVKAARQCVCSSGERVLLHAILCVTDFAWLADELGGGEVWRDFARVSGDHRRAVVACIAAEVW
jgi:hypothetical protein